MAALFSFFLTQMRLTKIRLPTMSKLQRIVIIIAAFGVVSIILTQAQSFSLTGELAVNETRQDAAQSNTMTPTNQQTVHIHHPNSSASHVDNGHADSGSQATFVTNIYQSGSGSFYFENTSPDNVHASKTYNPAQLASTKADITVTGSIARTRLTQVFSNSSDTPKSGIYVFPLPTDAAVDHLLMQVGERKIEGRIEPKATAQKLFQKAKLNGKKASLVEQLRPNMFTNQIANIPPQTEITVTIEYQQFITQDNYNFALRLPLSITPRYAGVAHRTAAKDVDVRDAQVDALLALPGTQSIASPINELSADIQYITAPTEINISLNTGLPLRQIKSEHHPIQTTNPHSTEYRISLDSKQLVNKDFVLQWQIKPSYSMQASHFRYQSNQYEYGLISLVPPEQDALDAKRNLVFVLDVSGSMVGDALSQAKQSLAYAIEDLNENDYFNLVTFSHDASKLWAHSQQASQDAVEDALTYIYNLEANGGTEIRPALDLAFDIPSIQDEQSSYLNQILFITDGSVSNENEIMQDIYQNLGEYRLFTVGIGNAPNAFFMSEAAAAGRGTFTFIGDIALVNNKMKRLTEKLKKPALSDIQLNIKDAQHAFGFEVYPSILPDLYAGEPLVLTYRREIKDEPTDKTFPFSINGKYLAKTANGDYAQRTWSSQLPGVNTTRERGIHKYWARQKINSLNKQMNMQKPPQLDAHPTTDKIKDKIKEAIVNVALEHHLVSKYTSLIAIDHEHQQFADNTKNSADANTRARANSFNQYANASLPSTSTASVLHAFIGVILILLSLSLLLLSYIKGVKTTYES